MHYERLWRMKEIRNQNPLWDITEQIMLRPYHTTRFNHKEKINDAIFSKIILATNEPQPSA